MTQDACVRAEALVQTGQWEGALHELGFVLASEPNNARALCLVARAQLGLGRLQDALESATRAAALEPDDDWPLRLIALANARMGRGKEAVQAAKLAIKAAPTNWATHYQLAASRHMTNRLTEEAVTAIDESIRLAPNEPDAHRLAGQINFALGRHADARRCFRAALTLNPQDAVARHELARIELKRGRLGMAADGFSNAVAMDPRIASGVSNLDLVVLMALRRALILLTTTTMIALVLVSRPASLVAASVASIAVAIGIVRLWRKAGRRLRAYIRDLSRRDPRLAGLGLLLLIAWAALWLNAIAQGIATIGLVALFCAIAMHRHWLARRRFGSR